MNRLKSLKKRLISEAARPVRFDKHPGNSIRSFLSRIALSAIIGVLLFTGLYAGNNSTRANARGYTTNDSTARKKNGEVRAVWLTNVDSEVLYSPQNIAAAMRRLSRDGFNLVFPVVWNGGFTLHPSDVMAGYFGEDYRQDTLFAAKNMDPLQQVIVEAHRQGMEVIPWFEFGFASSHSKSGEHILKQYPHWAARNQEGDILSKNGFKWMNPFHSEVRSFMTQLIMEVVRNYDIDGIQGDDRLPALPAEGGYSEYTRNLYLKEMGEEPPRQPLDSTFMNWKAGKLTEYAGNLYNKVKQADSELIVSFSPSIYPWSYNNYLQDSPEWLRRGYVDLLIPQVYRWELDSYKSTLKQTMGHYPSGDRRKCVLASGMLIKVGDRYNQFDYIAEALRYNRELQLQGEAYFFYEGLYENNDFLADSIGTHFYDQPAPLPYRSNSETERRPEAFIYDEEESNDLDPEKNASYYSMKSDEQAFDSDIATITKPVDYRLKIQQQGMYDIYTYISEQTLQSSENLPIYKVDNTAPVEVLNSFKKEPETAGWHKLFTIKTTDLYTVGDELTIIVHPSATGDDSTSFIDAVMILPNRNNRKLRAGNGE